MERVPSIADLELENKATFVRVDFNVPLTPELAVRDDTRIREALATIQHIRERQGRAVLASHLGRPKGTRVPEMSLLPAAERLAALLDTEVVFADDCVGDGVKKHIKDLRPGGVLVLENLRFHQAETDNHEAFARALADGIDVYVNDAFGTAHRSHASTSSMARFVRDRAAGFLMAKELEELSKLSRHPQHPFVAVVGGAKVSDKAGVLKGLIERASTILVGGAMAYTFLAARRVAVGNSRVERELLGQAEQIMKSAQARNVDFRLPSDHRIAKTFDESAAFEDASIIPEGYMGLDIGPETRAAFADVLQKAKTVFWNGPMGVFEWTNFAQGTLAVAHACADSQAHVVVGGGDSVAALAASGRTNDVAHVSTGGGASLMMLEGKKLPGVTALMG